MMEGSVALVCNNRRTLDPVALQCNKLGIDGEQLVLIMTIVRSLLSCYHHCHNYNNIIKL